MNNKLYLTLIFFALNLNAQDKTESANVFSASHDKVESNLIPIDVSLEKLIKNPKEYNKKYVKLFGFLSLDLTNSALYISRKDFEQSNTSNAIIIVHPKEDIFQLSLKINKEFVYITGIFHLIEKSDFSSGLFRIQSIDRIK